MMYYVFDLDNTIAYTDMLNSLSYKKALHNYGKLLTNSRITRELVVEKFPSLSKNELSKIISLKQDFFSSNLDLITVNQNLIQLINKTSKDQCILWTSADSDRALAILKYLKIEDQFSHIIFSEKDNVAADMNKIISAKNCNIKNLHVYEDNEVTIRELEKIGIKAN